MINNSKFLLFILFFIILLLLLDKFLYNNKLLNFMNNSIIEGISGSCENIISV